MSVIKELTIVGRLVEIQGTAAVVTFKMGDMPTGVIRAEGLKKIETTENGAMVGLILRNARLDELGIWVGTATNLHRLGAPA
jgi:hypothetical protein